MMFTKKLSDQSPIVVFGTGGSGTRVVAEILRESGCYIGSNLNRALDNQDFGFFLGGRVNWMEKYFPFTNGEADAILMLFKKIYFKQNFNAGEYVSLGKIALEYMSGKSWNSFRKRPLSERLRRGLDLLRGSLGNQTEATEYVGWAFKSPEAIYFLKALVHIFPSAKFIHVIRDGRDMAVSTNKNPTQYISLFGIQAENPVKISFENWLKVNTWALEQARLIGVEHNYLLLRYEDLCQQPVQSLEAVFDFLGLNPTNKDKLFNIPRSNPQIGRWKKYANQFRNIDKEALVKLGYQAE